MTDNQDELIAKFKLLRDIGIYLPDSFLDSGQYWNLVKLVEEYGKQQYEKGYNDAVLALSSPRSLNELENKLTDEVQYWRKKYDNAVLEERAKIKNRVGDYLIDCYTHGLAPIADQDHIFKLIDGKEDKK